MLGIVSRLLLACCLAWPAAHAQDLPETPHFRVLGVRDGLPSETVWALARDRAGYLWIGSNDGLARYDGVGFQTWRHQPGDAGGLPRNVVQALHVDAADRLWIATEHGGVSMLDAPRRRLRHYATRTHPEMADADVLALASRGQDVWFGSFGGGVQRLDAAGRFTSWRHRPQDAGSLPSDNVLALAFDGAGRLWVGTDAGAWILHPDGSGARVQVPGDAAALVMSVTPHAGRMWLGSSTGVVSCGNADDCGAPAWSAMFASPNMPVAMAFGEDGRAWLAAQRGLWRVREDGVPVRVPLDRRLEVRSVMALLLQPDGALWTTVPGRGLGFLRSDWRALADFRREDGLAGDLYRGTAAAQGGGLWVAGTPGVVERITASGSVERLDLPQLRDLKFFSVLEDAEGRLWLGHGRGLLVVERDGRVRQWSSGEGTDAVLPSGAERLAGGRDGTLWVLSIGHGLQQRDLASGRVLRSFPATPGTPLATADADALRVADDGAPWLAGADGVLRLDPRHGAFERILPSAAQVDAFAFDGEGGLWVHGLQGLARVRQQQGRWQLQPVLGARDGLPATESTGLLRDSLGQLWMATPRGLFRWDPLRGALRRFGLRDGLQGEGFRVGTLVQVDARRIAVASTDGAVVMLGIHPSGVAGVTPPLRLDALQVQRDGRAFALPHDRFALLPGDRDLAVEARLLAFDDPASNGYESMLEGFDAGWVDQGNDPRRVFSSLAPGDYRLHLRARDVAGIASEPISLVFSVRPPWWRTTWARAGSALFAMLALLLAARGYRQRLRRQHAWQLARQQRDLAEQASRAKTEFLADFGHEVRTPMTGVLGMSELLLGTPLDPDQRARVQSIRRAGEHLQRLMDDALDLARIEAGRLALLDEPFELHALCAEVTAWAQPLAERKQLRLRLACDLPAPCWLRGDAARVRQIAMNLLGNALKFTDSGEVALEVDHPATGGLRLQVRDTGPGMDEEQQRRLFARFEQAEGARTTARHGGTGLGLAISRRLAEAMGGTLSLHSVPGQGSCFTVQLPLADAQAAASSAPVDATSAMLSLMGDAASLDLLLVEDDPLVAEVITGLLHAQGHRVRHAAHGLAALAETVADRFDAALLDLDLPVMDGCELAAQLRAQGFGGRLVALTARADAQAQAEALAAGFNAFLRKPLTGAMLAQALAAREDALARER